MEAGDLANSFGRIGSVAADMGLSLEEVTGALSAITVRGSKTSEALTQVRAITTGLLKPSEEMAKTLKALGFESGESAVKTLGLAGTLKALADTTRGSSAQMAKLFPNVRGLSGATTLLGDDLRSVSSAIEQMTSVGRGFANEKFLQATATDAEVVKRQLNQVKNAIVTDIGQSLLSATKQALAFSGGVDTLVSAIDHGTPVILGAAAAVTGLGAKFAAARVSGLALSGAIGSILTGLAAVPLAIGAGESIGDFLNDKLNESRNKSLKALEATNQSELQSFTETQQKKIKAANDADAQIVANARKAAQAINRIATPDQIAKALNSDSATSALERVLGHELTTVDQLANGLEAAAKKAAELRKAIADTATAGKQVDEVRNEIGLALDSVKGNGGGFGGAFADDMRAQLALIKTMAEQLSQSTNVTDEQLDKLIQKRNEFGKAALEGDNPLVGKLGFAQDIVQLDQALTKLQQLKSLQATSTVDPGLQAQLSQLEAVLAANPAGQFGQATAAMNAAVGPTEAIANAWERAAAAAQRAAAAAAAGVTQRSFGGTIHLATGGSARGMDTIPAMLSPGEFVMNAKSSRKFFSQLTAMNAGQQPAFRQDGGSVNNDNSTTIGDVHLHANPTTTRELMKDIHREVRRKTGRIE